MQIPKAQSRLGHDVGSVLAPCHSYVTSCSYVGHLQMSAKRQPTEKVIGDVPTVLANDVAEKARKLLLKAAVNNDSNFLSSFFFFYSVTTEYVNLIYFLFFSVLFPPPVTMDY